MEYKFDNRILNRKDTHFRAIYKRNGKNYLLDGIAMLDNPNTIEIMEFPFLGEITNNLDLNTINSEDVDWGETFAQKTNLQDWNFEKFYKIAEQRSDDKTKIIISPNGVEKKINWNDIQEIIKTKNIFNIIELTQIVNENYSVFEPADEKTAQLLGYAASLTLPSNKAIHLEMNENGKYTYKYMDKSNLISPTRLDYFGPEKELQINDFNNWGRILDDKTIKNLVGYEVIPNEKIIAEMEDAEDNLLNFNDEIPTDDIEQYKQYKAREKEVSLKAKALGNLIEKAKKAMKQGKAIVLNDPDPAFEKKVTIALAITDSFENLENNRTLIHEEHFTKATKKIYWENILKIRFEKENWIEIINNLQYANDFEAGDEKTARFLGYIKSLQLPYNKTVGLYKTDVGRFKLQYFTAGENEFLLDKNWIAFYEADGGELRNIDKKRKIFLAARLLAENNSLSELGENYVFNNDDFLDAKVYQKYLMQKEMKNAVVNLKEKYPIKKGEPFVYFYFSENPAIKKELKMSLRAADEFLAILDMQVCINREIRENLELKPEDTSLNYYGGKTDFAIIDEYGKKSIYRSDYEIGNGWYGTGHGFIDRINKLGKKDYDAIKEKTKNGELDGPLGKAYKDRINFFEKHSKELIDLSKKLKQLAYGSEEKNSDSNNVFIKLWDDEWRSSNKEEALSLFCQVYDKCLNKDVGVELINQNHLKGISFTKEELETALQKENLFSKEKGENIMEQDIENCLAMEAATKVPENEEQEIALEEAEDKLHKLDKTVEEKNERREGIKTVRQLYFDAQKDLADRISDFVDKNHELPWNSNKYPMDRPQRSFRKLMDRDSTKTDVNYLMANYKDFNQLNLSLTAMEKGYKDSRWITMRDVQKNYGCVKRGEHGVKIFVYVPAGTQSKKYNQETKRWELETKTDKNGNEVPVVSTVGKWQYHTVFNIEQTIGLHIPKEVQCVHRENTDRVEKLDKYFTSHQKRDTNFIKEENSKSLDAYYSEGLNYLCTRICKGKDNQNNEKREKCITELAAAFTKQQMGIYISEKDNSKISNAEEAKAIANYLKENPVEIHMICKEAQKQKSNVLTNMRNNALKTYKKQQNEYAKTKQQKKEETKSVSSSKKKGLER